MALLFLGLALAGGAGWAPAAGRDCTVAYEETLYQLLVEECTAPDERVRQGVAAWCAENAWACEDGWPERVQTGGFGAIVRAEVLDRRVVKSRFLGFVCQGPDIGSLSEFMVRDDEPGPCGRVLAHPRAWFRERISGRDCDTTRPGPVCLIGLPIVRLETGRK